MRRTRKSLLNAIAAVTLTTVTGLFALVFTKVMLIYLGSDFNGLNSTASQLVTILNLFEGGFTIAINVALFKPYFNHEIDTVNSIVSATKSIFRKIGVLSASFGIVIALGYSFIINSSYPQPLIFCVFLMTLLPVSFNFYYATKYSILLQAEQSEYVISFITLATNVLGYIGNIFLLYHGSGLWQIRLVTMCFSIINSLIIGIYVREKFPRISYNARPDFEAIKGTGDVFVQKLTGVAYSTAPIVCLTLTAGGTTDASVYAVYNNIFVLLKGVMYSVINAPRLGLGELAAEGDQDRLWNVFIQYELIIKIMLMAFLTTAAVLIMPFIEIYTSGISDGKYYQPLIALMLTLICFFEHLHMPSGHLINMTGNFKKSRNIQLIAIIILLVGCAASLITGWGIIGILGSVLCTAICLCLMEVGYVYTKIFSNKMAVLLKHTISVILISLTIVFLELRISLTIHGYLSFFIWAVVLFVVNAILALVSALIIDKDSACKIFLNIFKNSKLFR